MNPKVAGFLVALLVAWAVVLLVLAHRDYTLNTTGKAVPYSVTPEDCLTGQYPKAAENTCITYLKALNQRLSGENK